MPLSKIKKEFLNKRVSFGKGGGPLFKRADIDELAIIAQESKDPGLLILFEVLPDLHVLKKNRVDKKLKAVAEVKGKK